MDRIGIACLLFLVATALACSDGGSATADSGGAADAGVTADAGADTGHGTDAGTTADSGWVELFAPAVCGAPAFHWFDPGSMGKVIEYEAIPEYSLDKKGLNDLLAQQGFKTIEAQYGIKLYRYRYETQDRGAKVEATALIAIPDLQGAEATLPYILWLHGTSGWSDRCAASRTIDWILAAGLLASQGYVGVAPDYIGMNGFGEPSTVKNPYMVGEATALASWDAARAAGSMLKRVRSGITPDNRVIIWGGSQGGHATLFAERYAPYYAPGFDVTAALALIPPANLVEDLIAVFNDFNYGLYFRTAITVALARWYGHDGRLGEVFNQGPPNDFTALIPQAMDTECSFDLSTWGVDKATDVYTPSFVSDFTSRDWPALDPWHCLFAENSIDLTSVRRTSATPFFWVIGEKDDLVREPGARQEFDTLCAAGYSMDFLECRGDGHAEAGMSSMAEQIAWVKARFDGKPLSNPCVKSDPVCCSGAKNADCPKR